MMRSVNPLKFFKKFCYRKFLCVNSMIMLIDSKSKLPDEDREK